MVDGMTPFGQVNARLPDRHSDSTDARSTEARD
jgi:hypothetical protein